MGYENKQNTNKVIIYQWYQHLHQNCSLACNNRGISLQTLQQHRLYMINVLCSYHFMDLFVPDSCKSSIKFQQQFPYDSIISNPTYNIRQQSKLVQKIHQMFQQQLSNLQSTSSHQDTQHQSTISHSHHYLYPSTLTQLSLEYPSRHQLLEKDKEKERRSGWRSWSESEHILLCALFRQIGPCWSQMTLHFQERQSGQIKRHFYASLKKIYEQLVSKDHPTAQCKFKSIDFRDLKKMVDEMKKQQNRNHQMYTQSIIATMLAAQHTNDTSLLEDDLKKLRENLVKVKALLSKKHSQASTVVTEKEQVQILNNRIEQGYQSDSSSFFEEQIDQERNQLPTGTAFSQDQLFRQISNSNEGAQFIGGRVEVQQEEDKIRELLNRQGLLQFEKEQICNLQNRQCSSLPLEQNELCEDRLQNESYQHFCTIDVIETNKASYKAKSAGENLCAGAISNIEQSN